MDGRRPGVWCVLVLLLVRDAVSQVNQITLVSMTWSTDPALGLTVCAENDLSFDTSFLTVRFFNGSETGYGGLPEETDPKCTVFTDIADLPLPEVDATTYELTTYIGNDSVDEGKVTFAFPLSQGVKIDCGSSQFTRFSVVDGGDSALSGTGCISNSDSSACYFTGDSDPVCVPGLDQTLDEPDSFEVCVPNGGDPIAADKSLISAVSLSYDEDRIGGIFTISSETETNPIELLSVIHDSGSDPSVTICDGNECTFASGDPSIKVYDLCSVYVDSDGNVASVGNYSFQDLQLTVDVVSDTTVDFRFANLNSDGGLIYDVYGGGSPPDPTVDEPSFTLDCVHISEDSFCNGFFDNEDSLKFIGVSFSGDNDIVIAPTTPPTTTTTTTSSTTASPKVEENAMDLTDQKTEGIVPSSA